MRFTGDGSRPRVPPLEITAMIDVVFLLIIFFMTTARFAQETRAELDLPQEQGEQQEKSEEAGIVINVDRDGNIIVGTDPLELEDLVDRVRDEIERQAGGSPSQLKLLLRADRNAETGRLNEVISALQKLGVGAARVATEVP